ncbi:MAG: hypothetical protein JWQ66_3281 [Mucilaginibacter sp.]|nr:hypothetical protein [Mucilaginibacter sp.]
MNTNVKDNSKAVNNAKTDKTTEFVNANPVNKEAVKPQPEAEKPKEEAGAVKAEQAKSQAEPTKEAEAPKAHANEQPKTAEPKPEPVKHVLNLEETLKLVAELNRRKIQRDKLMETIDNLDAFEIELKEDADETDGNIYQGCVLTIEDDNRRKFSTKNPVIIWTVAQQVNSMCVNKLSEIEAGIIIPQ